MKQKRLNYLASLLSLAVLSLGIISAPLLSAGAATNNLLDSQIGLNKVGEQYGSSGYDDEDSNLIIIIVRIINFSASILGLLFVTFLVISGYQWMTAAGNEEQIKSAKKRMMNAVIGLVIVLLAWSITQFVFYRIVMPATTGNNNYAPWF
ncbi:MAG TPA: pilin [bacterium]|nr:pilin [bacterium]HPT29759.1 pilin [bacterium]